VSAHNNETVNITSTKEFTKTALSDILNLVLHIVYKRDGVEMVEKRKGEEDHIQAIRRLADMVWNGGYNVTGEILTFLSGRGNPIMITPTRWQSKDGQDAACMVTSSTNL